MKIYMDENVKYVAKIKFKKFVHIENNIRVNK